MLDIIQLKFTGAMLSLSGKISLMIMVVTSGIQKKGVRGTFSLVFVLFEFLPHMYITSSSKPINIKERERKVSQ